MLNLRIFTISVIHKPLTLAMMLFHASITKNVKNLLSDFYSPEDSMGNGRLKASGL